MISKRKVLCIPILLLCILSVGIFVNAAKNIYLNESAKNWAKVSGLVIDIKTERKHAVLFYEYEISNKKHFGNKYAFLTEGSVVDRSEIVRNYDVGDSLDLFVNPNNESKSVVLRRDFHVKYFLTNLWVGFISLLAAYALYTQD